MGLFGSLGRSKKSSAEMSDEELLRYLERSKGRNTGESVGERANKILEAKRRGLIPSDESDEMMLNLKKSRR